MKVYCIFCKTGAEHLVAAHINANHSNKSAIVPVRVLQEKYRGSWKQREQALLPGYVFVYMEEEAPFENIKGSQDIYKVLEYQRGTRELAGEDLAYAQWVYRHHGVIGISKAFMEGSTVKVIEGPLLDGMGTILKIDRHKRRAWVEFDFDGKKQKVSLSIEDVTPYEH